MAIRKFRYDAPDVRQQKPARPVLREDREPVRLLTRLTFSRMLSRLGTFRVLARNILGEETLVCMGLSRDEALETARKRAGDLPADAVSLTLEEWQGGTCQGRWRRQPCDRGELPVAPGSRRPRRQRRRQ